MQRFALAKCLQVGERLVDWSQKLQPALQDFLEQAQRATNSDCSVSSSSDRPHEFRDLVAAVGELHMHL
jgi:hypothetical protein